MASEESGAGAVEAKGFFHSLRTLFGTFLDLVQTRLELALTELEEEQQRLKRTALLAVMALFFASLGVIFLTLLVVMLFWDSHRIWVLGGFSLLYLALGAGAGLLLRRQTQSRPKLFSSTLAELAKDRSHLKR